MKTIFFVTTTFFPSTNTAPSRGRQRGLIPRFLLFSAIPASLKVSIWYKEWLRTRKTASTHVNRHPGAHLHHFRPKKHNLPLRTAVDSSRRTRDDQPWKAFGPLTGTDGPCEVWKVTQDQCAVSPHSLGCVGSHSQGSPGI